MEFTNSPGGEALQERLRSAFPNANADDRARFASLLESIRTPRDVSVDVAPRGEREWTVTIATADFLGALSIVVGLLSTYRLGITSADIQTLTFSKRAEETTRVRSGRSPRGATLELGPPARRLLGVYEVRALDAPLSDLWLKFSADLTALFKSELPEDALDDVVDRVSEWFRSMSGDTATLLPVSIDTDPSASSTSTRLTVRSADTPGFLFAFANALASMTLNVEHAEIRTVEGEAADSFWVTDVQRRPIVDEKSLHELRVATTLIKHFTFLLPRSPNPGQALRQFNALISQIRSRPAWIRDLSSLGSPVVLQALADLMGVSRFLWEDFLRMQHESLFPLLLDVPSLEVDRTRSVLLAEARNQLPNEESLASRVDLLNDFKDREMFRIDLRHIIGRSDFGAFSLELTALAEVAVKMAAELAREELAAKFGTARTTDGRPCPWCVCALGKFGGRELGFGSDLELLFVYEGEGVTDGPRSILASEYFAAAVQAFLRILKARQEGIFEIDLRLRPFGKAGSLASSLDGFRSYYRPGGGVEQFERLALVRLRPVAGDAELAARTRQARDAFVYSGQPLDLENIRHLRHRQATELVSSGTLNVKYGAGGVADLEYFVQAWQILVGESDPSVRVTNTFEAIQRLARGQYLDPELTHQLEATYDFLRRLIDALRVVRGNAKDLTLPLDNARELAYLARRLRLANPETLQRAIAAHLDFNRSLWTLAPPRRPADRPRD